MSDVVEKFEQTLLSAKSLAHTENSIDFFPGASEQQISECEARNDWGFPPELKEFLLYRNGECRESDPLLFTCARFCSLNDMSDVQKVFSGSRTQSSQLLRS